MTHYVEIVSYETSEVVERMGPMEGRQAVRCANGIDINLNHDEFFTRVVPVIKEG